MRADRLVATLLLLQQRKQVTALEVARELEVSERTARRDLEALSVAGVPVYSMQGRGGGWRLLGGARTDLSGLTASEARALFLVAGPASTATPEVKAALRKLVRALPEPFREQAEAAATSLVVDPRHWGASEVVPRPPQFLDDLQEAVIRGVQIRLGYVDRQGSETERTVHPLGIVAKGPTWYLVSHTEAGRRTFRIDRVSSVQFTDDPVQRPQGFDLAQSWREIADEVDRKRTPIEIQALCVSDGLGLLRMMLGGRLEVGGSTPDGRIEVVIRGHNEYALAGQLAGLVEWLEVTGPQGVRDHLAAIGTALAARYR
ncbi:MULTISPECIES: helix-turn-helix transcriptional regulator [Mycolicibacter]|uniref:Transcriptional regulator n=1 Tax=Mycolicibacter virginiensis TaxID=1795032 RepID=A0A9X7NXQ9_9MYCO|nr:MULTISPECIES: WYL domain-containing protein [Mycolicibacter]OBG32930.1 transcriptional regulator [Mycolicibacter heraklionensis]OBJ28547.1 transcriptional regulator [Mycolicibacter heraklionensis]PQM51204.1 transcriptional regulator [Mycolicibacter virginiensis]ULP47640.1 WYL domain-containing protein [Mycolicibacter virginiensis]